MSRQHPSSREQHAAHQDARIMVGALARQERRAAERSLIRALRTMVQPHEPHHFAAPIIRPGDGRPLDWLAAPGGPDHTGFCELGGIC